ncbi:MAG: 50S ribosomal protein L10 [Pseudomonadota bacterium]|nr:50S ribosomal protein L10 [Pseudomonadota bacterium]MDE3038897.1 50S ribosomal protein L10 [Pseudomonadota bacterium]
MNRTEKQASIESVNATLKKAQIALVVHNNGLTVAQMSQLRGKLREVGAEFKVSKNRLARIAAKDTPFEQIADLFKGPSAIATSADPVSVARGIVDFAKAHEKLVIVGGAYGAQKLDVKAIEALSKLPSLNELRAKIVGMLKTPATRIACVLQAPGGQVARVIAAKAKKES